MLRRILTSGLILAAASTAWASQVITPAGWGNVTGAFESDGMFDHQPTWDGTALSGGDQNYNAMMASWDPLGATSYIDFGPNYASIQIEQLWTQGMAWRATPGFPYTEVWWDNDVANTTLTGTNLAATLNFNTKGSVGGDKWVWQQDFDYAASPITPQAQFLKLRVPYYAATEHGGSANITGTTELAIIGTVPEPASLTFVAGAAALMMRRRR